MISLFILNLNYSFRSFCQAVRDEGLHVHLHAANAPYTNGNNKPNVSSVSDGDSSLMLY
jgi:hypothetical protein